MEEITISVAEYHQLLEDQKLLNALRAGGVDNWEGWDDAIKNLFNAKGWRWKISDNARMQALGRTSTGAEGE